MVDKPSSSSDSDERNASFLPENMFMFLPSHPFYKGFAVTSSL
jgi:hypothetical protein